MDRNAAALDVSWVRAQFPSLQTLVNGQPAGTRPPESLTLAAGAEIEVLPPFAGG